MESWRKVFREGFAPILSTPALKALQKAVQEDDLKLIQGATTNPPPLRCVMDWPVEMACAVSFCGVVDHGGFGISTVGQVEEDFSHWCFECDQRLGEPAACRWFLNWFDETSRAEVFRLLLPEIELELERRKR